MDDDGDARRPRRHARSFGPVADAYDRGRPSFPVEAAAWLVGSEPRDGARARRRDRQADRGPGRARPRRPRHRARPRDADGAAAPPPRRADQRGRRGGDPAAGPLGRRGGRGAVLPLVRPRPRAAGDRAGAAARRLPRACAWNNRDTRIPWVRKLGQVLGDQPHAGGEPPTARSTRSCRASSSASWRTRPSTFWQDVNRESLVDLVASRSYVATLDDAGAGGEAGRGPRAVRRLRPRHGRDAGRLPVPARSGWPERCPPAVA